MSIPAPPCLLVPPDKCLAPGRRGRGVGFPDAPADTERRPYPAALASVAYRSMFAADTAPTTRRHRRRPRTRARKGPPVFSVGVRTLALTGGPLRAPCYGRATALLRIPPPRGPLRAPSACRARVRFRPTPPRSCSVNAASRGGFTVVLLRSVSDLFGRRYPSSSSATSTPRAAAMASA